MSLILASASRTRQTLLKHAGVSFETVAAQFDEHAAERPLIEALLDLLRREGKLE